MNAGKVHPIKHKQHALNSQKSHNDKFFCISNKIRMTQNEHLNIVCQNCQYVINK